MTLFKKIIGLTIWFMIIIIAISFILEILFLGLHKIISWIPSWLFVFSLVIGILYFIFKTKIKSYFLMRKYEDQKIVDRIIKKIMWEGAIYEHIIDMFGRAESIDMKMLRGKKREVLKYDYDDKRRTYLFRVTLENNKVIGWETLNIKYKRTKFSKPISLVDY